MEIPSNRHPIQILKAEHAGHNETPSARTAFEREIISRTPCAYTNGHTNTRTDSHERTQYTSTTGFSTRPHPQSQSTPSTLPRAPPNAADKSIVRRPAAADLRRRPPNLSRRPAGRENGGNCDIKNLSRGCKARAHVSPRFRNLTPQTCDSVGISLLVHLVPQQCARSGRMMCIAGLLPGVCGGSEPVHGRHALLAGSGTCGEPYDQSFCSLPMSINAVYCRATGDETRRGKKNRAITSVREIINEEKGGERKKRERERGRK
jgi:hypothetical protein